MNQRFPLIMMARCMRTLRWEAQALTVNLPKSMPLSVWNIKLKRGIRIDYINNIIARSILAR